jgi:hypothetical protein
MAARSTGVKLTTIFGITILVLLLDWLYVIYITTHGLEVRTQPLMLDGVDYALPLEWLPVIGIAVVSLVAWYEVWGRIFPRRGVEFDHLSNLRLVRVIVISVALFVCVLYIPMLLGSNWFWAGLSDMSKSVSQVRDLALSLLGTDQAVGDIYPLYQYSISQVLATAALVLSAWSFGRVTRRPRKTR